MRLLIAATVLLLTAATADQAKADPYRWCAQDMGESGATNCYFLTLEQCKAAASGAGSFCTPNTFYTGPETASPRASKRRR